MTVQELKQELNQCGRDWYEMYRRGDESGCERMKQKIWVLLFTICNRPGVLAKYGEEDVSDGLTDFMTKTWSKNKFDPNEGDLSGYAHRCLFGQENAGGQRIAGLVEAAMRKRRDAHSKRVDEPDGTIRTVWVTPEELDAPLPGGDGLTQADTLRDHRNGFEAAETEVRLLEMMGIMLTINQRLHGRANNLVRQNYFRMFFTDGVTVYCKDNRGRVRQYVRHERELFQAMKLPFLDYYMLRSCRGLEELGACPLKSYGELVEGREEKECPLPLHADVYIAYLDRIEHYRAGNGAMSMQREAYSDFMREQLGLHAE